MCLNREKINFSKLFINGVLSVCPKIYIIIYSTCII